jgi:hypothetical protein
MLKPIDPKPVVPNGAQYEPPQAMHLCDAKTGSGVCLETGSGDAFGCIAVGSSAGQYCQSSGNGPSGSCDTGGSPINGLCTPGSTPF